MELLHELIARWRSEADRGKLLQGLKCADDLAAVLPVLAQQQEKQMQAVEVADEWPMYLDMLQVDRLRAWAQNIEVYGADVTHWGNPGFIAAEARRIADDIEGEIKQRPDVQTLRQQLTEAEEQRESHRQSMAAILHANDALCRELAEAEATRQQLEAEIAAAREACPSIRLQNHFDDSLLTLVNLEVSRGFNRDSEVAKCQAKLQEAESTRRSLDQAVRTILRGFDEGVFVRNIDGDTRSDWAVRLLPFIAALAEANKLAESDPERARTP
jgi:hypothetical protein